MIARRVKTALTGRSFWLKLQREYDVENGVYVILMPEDDHELNELALLHINNLIAYKKARGVVILTNQPWVTKDAGSYSDKILAVNMVAEKEIDNLLSFYELYAFTERLLIVSLTKPFGSKLRNMIGINGVTKEDLVCLCIFFIRTWSSEETVNG